MASKRLDHKKDKRAKKANGAKRPGPKIKTTTVRKEVTLTAPGELQELQNVSAMAISERLSVGACWFSTSAGRDQCIPLPREVCIQRGGVWIGGACLDFPVK